MQGSLQLKQTGPWLAVDHSSQLPITPLRRRLCFTSEHPPAGLEIPKEAQHNERNSNTIRAMMQEYALRQTPVGATRKGFAETSHRFPGEALQNDARSNSHHDHEDVESLAEAEEDDEEAEEQQKVDGSNHEPRHNSARKAQSDPTHGLVLPRRPFNIRPEPSLNTLARNKSPFSRAHLRSRSTNAVVMTRAHSSPGPSGSDFLAPRQAAQQTYQSHQPPATSRTPPARQRSPFAEEHLAPRPRSPRSWDRGISSIQEDVALDIPLSRPPVPLSRSGGSLRRSRPASPLHSVTNAVVNPSGSFSADGNGSPLLGPMQRHYSNDMYPGGSTASSSSVSSTPTSWMSRSRSPSISSLETIEDAGEEVEMKEAEEVEQLREAAEAEGRRSSFDGGSGRLRSVGRERKRWSVCGGERRGDLDLETIWED